jgi:CRISPR/Cas system-associated exonuclease Cas4 (RecB family)
MCYTAFMPIRKTRLYDPKVKEPFKLSRSKIENYIRCQRCFYLDRRLGVAEPAGFPFNLNSAVDTLFKKEFDTLRKEGKNHPLIEKYGIDAKPVDHPDLDEWRNNFKGVAYVHPESNFHVFGAIDDLWINDNGEFVVVDYKATSKDSEVTLDAPWQDGYKRQMEIYQWLLRQKGNKVSPVGYFVYANGRRDLPDFKDTLKFRTKLIAYKGDDSWVGDTLKEIKATLDNDTIPFSNKNCEYCEYRRVAADAEA